MIQNWWQGREKREQWLLSALGVIVALLILISGVIVPWRTALTHQQDLLTQQRNTLATAEKLFAQIQSLQHAGAHLSRHASLNLSSQIQHSLTAAKLTQYLTEAKQPTSGQMSLTLSAVPFDQLAAWLTQITQNYTLKIASWNTQASKQLGAVYTQITLST